MKTLASATSTAALIAVVAGMAASARPRPAVPWFASPDPPPGLPPAHTVTVPGHGELFYRDAAGPDSSAPTILLLHGWMFPADLNWFTSYGPLSKIGRVIAIDHRGHGRGTRPATPFRLEDVADDAAALLRALDAGPAVAVGYSMGGPVAQLLWRRHPDLVRGLVCCATAGTFSGTARERIIWRAMGALQVVLRLLPRFWTESLVQAQLAGRLPFRITRIIHDDSPEHLRQLIPWAVGEFDRGSREDIAEAGRELGRYDGRPWLKEVDVPSAAVITTRDQLVPVERQRALAALLQDCHVTELNADHDAPAGQPNDFSAAVADGIRHILERSPNR